MTKILTWKYFHNIYGNWEFALIFRAIGIKNNLVRQDGSDRLITGKGQKLKNVDKTTYRLLHEMSIFQKL